MSYLLGIDAGTTSIKAWLYDAQSGRPIAGAARPTPVAVPQPGWAEHDPEALWRATADCIREALGQAPAARPIAALAIASMAEAGVLLDEHGTPLYPIVAYYDPRTAPYVAWWRARIDPAALHAISGQVLRPVFGALKLLWLRDSYPELFIRGRRWLSVGDYLVRRLAGVDATDRSLASRTMLFDQRSGHWSSELLDIAGVAADLFPPVYPSGTLVGQVTDRAAAQTGLAAGTPVATGGHDHLCGGLAVGVVEPKQALVSLGTAAAVLAPSAQFHGDGLVFAQGLSCYSYVLGERYVVQGGLSTAGSALAWLARLLRGAARPEDYAALEDAATLSPPGARGLVCLPHLRGSGTPERDTASRAAFVGLHETHGPGDMWRALTESLAGWARQNLEAIEAATGRPIESLKLIGGSARGALLPQALADITGRAVALPEVAEAGAMGAALLAGHAVGIHMPGAPETRVVAPDLRRAAWYDRWYEQVFVRLYHTLRPLNHALGELNEPLSS
jgi:xylulokinase